MKPFWGIDLTTNKKNEKTNGDEFLVAVPSLALAQSLARSSGKADELIGKSKLSLPLRIGQWICGTLGAIVVIGILRALGGSDGVSLAQAYKNASWLFWLGGACLLVWGILKHISLRKEKKVLGNDEADQVFSNLDSICAGIYSELSVPADAKEVDILSFAYKVKDGNIRVSGRANQITPYSNPVFRIFADSENLYIANLYGKYAFPLSSMAAIRTVKKSIFILGWNKDMDFKDDIYKQYKLTADRYGRIQCRRYHILEFTRGGEVWGIYFPSYELPVFEALTGRKADCTDSLLKSVISKNRNSDCQ